MGKFINQILPLMTTDTVENKDEFLFAADPAAQYPTNRLGQGFSYWRRRPRCLYQSSLENLVAEIDGQLYAERDGLYPYPMDRLLGLYILLGNTPAGNAALKAGSSNSPWEQNGADPFCHRDGALHRSGSIRASRQGSPIRNGSIHSSALRSAMLARSSFMGSIL